MLYWNKLKKTLFIVLLCSAFPMPSQACVPLNPICLFKMLLKATPGFPVMDFVSIPGIIPHVPATLQKEAQAQLKKIADQKMKEIRGDNATSPVSTDKPDYPELETRPESQPYPSLEGFPDIDSTDPMAVAKAIEVLFVRPAWEESESLSVHDREIMKYQANMFKYNNAIEVAGFLAAFQDKFKNVSVYAEHVTNRLKEASDFKKSLRANYAATQMEYQLNLLYNELLAAKLQMDMAEQLANEGIILNKPILGAM